MFYFRRALFASLFVIFSTSPTIQIASASVLSIGMTAYVVIVRPYESMLSTVLSIVNELLLILMILPTSRFLDPVISPSQSSMMGSAFVGIVIATIVINWVAIIGYGGGQIFYKKIRSRKYKRVTLKYSVGLE